MYTGNVYLICSIASLSSIGTGVVNSRALASLSSTKRVLGSANKEREPLSAIILARLSAIAGIGCDQWM